eukprot:COSAG02_NODE_185_length_30442_cov_59.370168_15_plen_156_part_00
MSSGEVQQDSIWSKVGHDERAHASTDELVRTTQQLSPIQAVDSDPHDRQGQPAASSDGGTAASSATVANGQAGLSLPNTPSEPSLSEQPDSASQLPIAGLQLPDVDGQMDARAESLTISSLTAGAVAAAAAQPGTTFELRVRSHLLLTVRLLLTA